ncbi:hypothetical protein GOP47_0008396 [Adiantum capillus-veneris]|uniref:C2 domain-containing protein n=1 Tax=Adiantum capillus-veneris TaxID=13818 RepID=A0A9D4ZKE2_ADICA|nr:hypothetical protein GOP47_0008396 [Adiantum capillus-veneris]
MQSKQQPTPESGQYSDARQSKGNPSSTPSTSDCRASDHKSKDVNIDPQGDIEGGEYGFVELTLISAQGLKDVKMFGSMSPYAVVYIDPSCKHRTCISDNTGSSPVWDYFLRLPAVPPIAGNLTSLSNITAESRITSMDDHPDAEMGAEEEDDGHQRLTIQIFSQGVVSDVLVGTAQIPLQDIIQNAAGKLVNLSVQFKAPSMLPHDLLRHLHCKATCSRPGKNRNSWFFIAEGVDGEVSGGAAMTSQALRPTAAPDFLDLKAEGEGTSTGGVSRSSSSPNESTGHSPSSPHSGFLNAPPSLQQPYQHQHQHQHQLGGASKAMFDTAFDALVVADVANGVAAMSMLQGDRGSQNIVGDALLGLAMSQSLQGPFGPSSS